MRRQCSELKWRGCEGHNPQGRCLQIGKCLRAVLRTADDSQWSQPELLRRGVAIEVADFIILPHSFPNENELNFWTRQFASLKAKIATNALDMNGSVDVMRSVSRIHIRIQKNTCLMSWCPKVLTFSGTVRKCAIKPWTIRTIDLTAFSIKCQDFRTSGH